MMYNGYWRRTQDAREEIAIRSKTRIVRCCHCLGMMRVSARALSVACPHCQKRVTLENLRIIGAHPGRALATCGDIIIEARARLNLELCADNIVIHGYVRGPVVANQSVEIGSSGHVIGDIKAPKIIVQDGATIEGRCEMTRPIETAPVPSDSASPLDTESSDAEELFSTQLLDTAEREPSRPIHPRPLPPPPGKIRHLRFQPVDEKPSDRTPNA